MSNQVGVGGAIKSTLSKWEQMQKAKFVEQAQNPRMRWSDFLVYVENEIKQSKRMSQFNYKILCFKSDGVYQLNRAIQEVFGVVTAAEDKSPSGDNTINTIEVTLSDGQRIKVPYGDISLEELGEGGTISISYNDETHNLHVKGKCQFKYSSLMDDIIERTKELLANESIFKGHALEITDLSNPQIMNLSNIEREVMILSKQTQYELQPLESRILHPELCVSKGIPLKFGALLEGSYGTGKTLLAFKLAAKAVNNNWIFVYLKDPTLLADTMRLCQVIDQTGHGAIIFTEDIDQVTRGNRDAAMQDILNTLDGGDTKGMNVITLFTTNHIELIEPTFLRGKRIGSIISLGYLDAETAMNFLETMFKDGYTLEGNFEPICKLIADSNIAPAFMAEIVESVKSHMVFMDTNTVRPEYVEASVKSYIRQMQLAKTKDMSITPEQALVTSIKATTGVNEMKAMLKEIQEKLEEMD